MEIGKPLGNMVIKLDLDSAAFSKGLKGAKSAVTYSMKEMKAQMAVMNAAGDQLGVLGAKYSGLDNAMMANQNQIEKLNQAYKDSFDSSGNATASTTKYANELNMAVARQAGFESQQNAINAAMARYKVENEGLTGWINKHSEAYVKQGEKIAAVGDKISGLGSKLTMGVTVPLAAGAASVTKAAMSWESAFTGVKKTNDEILDSNGNVTYSYKDLENGLRGLAKELPSSHAEIAGVAEAAGQLGIQTDKVVDFTKVMIDMGESTNLSAETAATELAKFANITQMSQDKFSNLGASIVALGNNFATTESDISEMALRLAGAGHQVGMSEGDILGLSTALSSVGIEAEAGKQNCPTAWKQAA